MKLAKFLILSFCITLFGEEFKKIKLTQKEEAWLKDHGEVVLGVDNKFKPMNFTDKNGNLTGLNIDLILLIESKLPFNFKLHAEPWPLVFPKAMNHSIDGIINADKTSEREERLFFTDVFAHHPMAIYVRGNVNKKIDLASLRNKKVGVKRNTSMFKFLERELPSLNIIDFIGHEEALIALSNGEVDAVCGWYGVLKQTVKEYSMNDIIVSDVFLNENIGRSRIGIRNDSPELLTIINRAIMLTPKEEIDSVFNKWQPLEEYSKINYSLLYKILLPVVIVVILFIFWNIKLVQEIKKRKKTEVDLEKLIKKLEYTEADLNTHSDRLTIALKSSKAGIWDLDLTRNVLTWDDRMFELYGISRDDFTNEYEAWEHGIHPDDLEDARNELELAIVGEKDFNTEFRVLWPDKSIHFIKASGEVKTDYNDVPVHMIGVNFDITDEKVAEERLSLSEKRLRHVQAIAGIGYWDLDIATGELELSDEVFHIFGMKKQKEKILLGDFIDRIHPEDKSNVVEQYQNTVKEKIKYEIMHRIIQKDFGDVRYVLEHCEHTYNDNGEAVSSLGTIHDITDQILVEEEKKIFFDMSQDFIGIAEFNSHFRFVNSAFVDALGYSRDELLSKSFFDFIHPDDQEETGIAMSALIKGEKITDFENRYIAKDGAVRWLSWRASPDLEKGFIYYVARDITYSKMADTELRKNREQLRTVIDSVGSLIFMKDIYGHYLIINKTYEKTVGISVDDILGKTEYDIFPKDIADPIIEMDKKIIGSKETKTYEESVILKDGLAHNFITTKVPLFNEDGSVYGIVGMAVDITSRKKMEEELITAKVKAEEAYSAKSEFLANMSHEIRTPLNAVTGFSELLTTLVTDEKQKSYLKSIKSAGKALLHLINDVLDLSKLEAGKLTLRKEIFSVEELVKEIANVFYLDARNKDIELRTFIHKSVPEFVELDVGRLRQILLNLVGNAIKFTESGFVEINVNTKKYDDEKILNIVIKDTGIGISKINQKSIFENFKQQDGQDSRKYGGTGLGLSISKKLMHLMGGTIGLKSEIGKGSEFNIALPIISNVATSKDKLTNEVPVHNFDLKFRNKLVMVADDNKSNRMLIQELLERVGLTCMVFSSGEDLLKAFRKQKADLVITDIRMPEMGGVELLDEIKKTCRDETIPVYAYSASGLLDVDYDSINSRFDEYIKKPIDVNTFYNTLREYFPVLNEMAFDVDESIEKGEIISSGLLDYLKDEFLSSINELKGGVKLNDVMTLGEELLKLALSENSETVSTFAQKIIDAVDSMDVIFIRALPEVTNQFVKNIELNN